MDSIPFDDAFRRQVEKDLASFARRPIPHNGLTRAAVAVVLVGTEEGEAAFILTRRPLKLRRHAGQWALPCGRCDESVGSIGLVCEGPYLYCLRRAGIDSERVECFVLQGCGASDAGEGQAEGFVFDLIFRDRSRIRKKRSETMDGQPSGVFLVEAFA